MIKFMRKHNKKLLAIFASGLLIVWLGSSALQEMFRTDPRDEIVGSAFGQEFSGVDLGQAHLRTDVLGMMSIMWDRPWGGGAYNLPIKPVDHLTWFLLDQEARQSGIQVPRSEVDRLVKSSPQRGRAMEVIRDRRAVSIETIKDWIGDFMRINRVGQLAATSVKVSIPEIEHFVRDTGEKIKVRMAVLRADDFGDPEAKLDDAQLQDHFHKYKKLLPGEGEHGFGYKLPDRIRVQYIVADVDKVEKVMKVSREDARDYWSPNRKNFTKQVPLTTAPAGKPAASKPATPKPTTSSKPATRTEIKSFAEAYEDVVAEMRRERAPVLAEKIIRIASQRLHEPWYRVQLNKETGYKSAPPGADAPDHIDKIVADACSRNDLPAGALQVVKLGRWLTEADCLALEGIGKSQAQGQEGDDEAATKFSDLAFRVQNLYTAPKRSSERGLSLYETSNTMLRDTKNGMPHNFYLFRVVAAEAEHIPNAIDEQKDKIRKDVIKLKGYRKAGTAGTKLLAGAGARGIRAAVKADADLSKRLADTGVVEPEPFARKRSLVQYAIQFGLPLTPLWPVDELGVTEERKIGLFPIPMKMVAERYEVEAAKFIDACFGLAPASGAAGKPSRGVALVEMPNAMQWVVVEFIGIDRVEVAEFAKMRQQAMELLRTYRAIDFLKRWYDPDEVKARTKYERVEEEFEET